MEIDANKIKALCELSDEEFARVMQNVAKSAGYDQKTVENIVKNSPMIKKMLMGATPSELAMISSMLKKKKLGL